MFTVKFKISAWVVLASILIWSPSFAVSGFQQIPGLYPTPPQPQENPLGTTPLPKPVELPEITPTPEPTVEEEEPAASNDRQQSGGAAQALAAVGAALSFVSCALLMKAAMAKQGAERAEGIAKALDSCKQGMQDIGKAAENNDAANAATAFDPGGIPQLPFNDGPAYDIGGIPGLDVGTLPGVGDVGGPLDTSFIGNTGVATIDPTSPSTITVPDIIEATDISASISAIPQDNLDFDESAAGGSFASALRGLTGGPKGSESSEELDELNKEITKALQAISKDGKRKLASNGALAGLGGIDDFDINSIVNSFLGRGTGGLGKKKKAEGAQVLVLPGGKKATKDKKPKMTIFEYAHMRYQKASYKERRVSVKFKRPKKPRQLAQRSS